MNVSQGTSEDRVVSSRSNVTERSCWSLGSGRILAFQVALTISTLEGCVSHSSGLPRPSIRIACFSTASGCRLRDRHRAEFLSPRYHTESGRSDRGGSGPAKETIPQPKYILPYDGNINSLSLRTNRLTFTPRDEKSDSGRVKKMLGLFRPRSKNKKNGANSLTSINAASIDIAPSDQSKNNTWKRNLNFLSSSYHKEIYKLNQKTTRPQQRLSTAVKNNIKIRRETTTEVAKQWSTTFIERTVRSILERSSTHMLNVSVVASPQSGHAVLGGNVGDVGISFDRLAFRNIMISGGGAVRAVGMRISAPAFAPGAAGRYLRNNKVFTEGRFAGQPIEFHIDDCVLTQWDVQESSCIRNGINNLLNRILTRVSTNNPVVSMLTNNEALMRVKLETVDLLPSGRIMCKGLASTKSGIEVPFELRTGVTVMGEGHVLEFVNMELVFNPNFIPVVVPVYSRLPITLDMGNNFKVKHLSINGRKKQVELNAKVTVTPGMKDDQRNAYRSVRKEDVKSTYKCDVGCWLTNIGRFSK